MKESEHRKIAQSITSFMELKGYRRDVPNNIFIKKCSDEYFDYNEIRFIDEKHAADINIPNEPFPIRGRMVITYNGDRWEHTEKLLPSEQIEEMTFPDERWKKF